MQGVALWEPPNKLLKDFSTKTDQNLLEKLRNTMGEPGFLRAKKVFDLLEDLRKQDMPDLHWYLAVLVVKESQQRQGIGSLLLKKIRNKISDENIFICLWTDLESSLNFYKKFGFKVLCNCSEINSKIQIWTMRRH